MGVDQSKKRLGLKTGVEKGMFRPEIRSGVGLSLKCHTSPLPSPWGTRGKESLRLSLYPKEQSRSRARATGEQRSREEQRRKPKETIFTLSSPIPPPYYQQFAL